MIFLTAIITAILTLPAAAAAVCPTGFYWLELKEDSGSARGCGRISKNWVLEMTGKWTGGNQAVKLLKLIEETPGDGKVTWYDGAGKKLKEMTRYQVICFKDSQSVQLLGYGGVVEKEFALVSDLNLPADEDDDVSTMVRLGKKFFNQTFPSVSCKSLFEAADVAVIDKQITTLKEKLSSPDHASKRAVFQREIKALEEKRAESGASKKPAETSLAH